MLGVVVLVVAVLALLLLMVLFRARLAERAPSLPYSAKPFLLSKNEAAFYHSLCRAVGERYTIAMKVRLTDVLTCSQQAVRAGFRNKIAQKHLDFVICDPNSTKILAGIELDDRSHGRGDRAARDEFLDQAMRAAGLPLLRLPAAGQYDVSHMAGVIEQALAEQP
jgi:hypothetical protein